MITSDAAATTVLVLKRPFELQGVQPSAILMNTTTILSPPARIVGVKTLLGRWLDPAQLLSHRGNLPLGTVRAAVADTDCTRTAFSCHGKNERGVARQHLLYYLLTCSPPAVGVPR